MAPDFMQILFGFIAALVGLILLRRALRQIKANRQAPPTQIAVAQPPPADDAAQAAKRIERLRAATALAEEFDAQTRPKVTPPPSTKHGDVLARSHAQAILFQQHLPPQPDSRSYWGGVPLVPADLPWPGFTTSDGGWRSLSFIGQFDCAAIPADGRLGLMPEMGLLQLFLDLDWGTHWQFRFQFIDADPATLRPAIPPHDLPKLYDSPKAWGWPQSEAEWPSILPRFSFDPVLIKGRDLPAPMDEDEASARRIWPGSIDVPTELSALPGAIVNSQYHSNSYDADGRLLRPYANFPHDWRAVTITMGFLLVELRRGHLDRFVKRGELPQDEVDAIKAEAAAEIDYWRDLAASHAPHEAVSPADSDAIWAMFQGYQPVSMFCLTEAVNASIEATLAGQADRPNILPTEAFDLVRHRHALGSRGEHGLHINAPDRMLGPPCCPQELAEERSEEWLLLLQLSGNDGLAHYFGEGVYQFWIRPDDLAQRRFDRVELTAEAY